MQFDEVFEHIGQYKKYQIIICLLVSSQAMFMGFQYIGMNILAYESDHWCRVPRLENFTSQEQREISIPYNEDTGDYDKCKVYNVNWWKYSDEDLRNNSEAIRRNASVTECETWNFDTSEFEATAITEWNLVCDDSWYVSLTSSVFLAGFIVGAAFVGPMADTFGRRVSLFIFSGFHAVAQVGAVFSPNIAAFMILRALTAASTRATYSIGYTLCMEIVGPQYRSLVGQQYQGLQCIGVVIYVALSYYIRHFRYLMLAYSVPIALYLLLWFVIPESPRWLCSVGRNDEAKQFFERCANYNNTKLPENFNVSKIGMSEETPGKVMEGEEDTLMKLLRSPVLRRNMLCLILNFSLVRLIGYGASFGIGFLPGSVFVNLATLALFELPAYALSGYLMNRFGKIWTLLVQYILCLVLMYSAVPLFSVPDLAVLSSFLTLLGRAVVFGNGSIIVMMTAELNPTTLRNKCTGLSQGVSLLVTLGGPYISIELARVWDAMPSLIYASVGLVGAFTCMLLPETRGIKLPDNIAEAEQIGTGRMFPWYRANQRAENPETGSGEYNHGFNNEDLEKRDEKKDLRDEIFTVSKQFDGKRDGRDNVDRNEEKTFKNNQAEEATYL